MFENKIELKGNWIRIVTLLLTAVHKSNSDTTLCQERIRFYL